MGANYNTERLKSDPFDLPLAYVFDLDVNGRGVGKSLTGNVSAPTVAGGGGTVKDIRKRT